MKALSAIAAVLGISATILSTGAAFSAFSQDALPGKSRLTVPRVDLGPAPAIERVDSMFEAGGLPLHTIGYVNWPQHPKAAEVHFRIAHSGDEIYIKYYVHEDRVLARYGRDNGRPWTDTCVEFFVMPGVDETFYNLEMNCIGYGIMHGRMPGRKHGSPVEGLERVRRLTSMPRETFDVREGDFRWTVTLAVPVDLFHMSEVPPLSGRTVRANFYKCGDSLPTRHYLTWSPVATPSPSFHEPDFFGELRFE